MITYVECEYPFRLESMLHAKYKTKKAHGEWFYLTYDDVIHFKETCEFEINIINLMKDNIFFGKNLK